MAETGKADLQTGAVANSVADRRLVIGGQWGQNAGEKGGEGLPKESVGRRAEAGQQLAGREGGGDLQRGGLAETAASADIRLCPCRVRSAR